MGGVVGWGASVVLVVATGRLNGSETVCGASTAPAGISPRKAVMLRMIAAVRVLMVSLFVWV